MFDQDYFEKIMQELVNQSDEEKVKLIIENYMQIYPVLKRLDPEHEGMMLVYFLLGTAIAADGQVSREERAIVSAIHERIHGVRISDDEIYEMAKNSSNPEAYDLIKSICQQLDTDTGSALTTVVAGICALDNTIDRNELQFIYDLL